jgi:hypothetical protein
MNKYQAAASLIEDGLQFLWKKKKEVIIIFAVIAPLYWFMYLPYSAKKECNQVALEKSGKNLQSTTVYEKYSRNYTACMRSKGL